MRFFALLALLVARSDAQTPRPAKSAAADCAAIATLKLPAVTITSATAVQPTDAQRVRGRSALCRVDGVIDRETKFSALLPDNWNGRFFMGGTGGFAGAVGNDAQPTVNAGYATAGTDAGHEATTPPARWALNNIERVISYGHLGVHRTAVVVKQIIKTYYGTLPEKSYFMGCSNGGREALMAAQRYPEDFDGIIAIAPVISFSATASSFIRNLQAQFPTADFSSSVVTQENLALLRTRVWDACDVGDGVRDSVLTDPRTCGFRIASIPSCSGDVAADDCLTRTQRAAIEKIYAPVSANGRIVHPGQPFGNEGGWGPWITAVSKELLEGTRNGAPTAQGMFGTEFFKYMVFNDSTWDYTRYDIARGANDTRRVDSIVSPSNPDLNPFVSRGGKLIIAHGWSDPALNAVTSIDYYDAVRAKTRNHESAVRLFMMPGVLHCGGGTGCDTVDWYTAIANWVERGVAPERVSAAKYGPAPSPGAAPTTVRTRPLCAHPRVAVYSGTGSVNEEASFACK